MLNGVFCWHDKVDELYMPDSVVLSRSERSVCRGYITAFTNDRKLNPVEFELVKIGTFDDETGVFTALSAPEVVNVNQVFAKPDSRSGEPVEE